MLIAAAALMTLGVVMAASTAAGLDHSLLDAGSWKGPLGRQAAFAGAACVVMLLCSRLDIGALRWRQGTIFQPAVLVFVVTVAFLAAVWMPSFGHASHGRHRWLDLGPIGFQPSEFAKVGVVIFLSALLTRRRETGAARSIDAHFAIVALGIVCVLIGMEDFGTAALLAAGGGLVLLVGGCRLRALAIWALPAIGAFAYLLLSHPYRVERLLSFRNIWEDPLDTGYHPLQSMAAIASGGWTGRGLGAGMAQYGYLPEARTDFVFAVICEEMGLVGGVMVLLLFAAFVYFGLRATQVVSLDDGGFRALFIFGVTAMIGLQALMNVAVVTVLAPTKGIALPFVSAGGSGVMCLGAAVGLAAGVARRAGSICTADEPRESPAFAPEICAEGGQP